MYRPQYGQYLVYDILLRIYDCDSNITCSLVEKLDPQDPQSVKQEISNIHLFPLVLGVATETIPDIIGKGLFKFTVVFLLV